MKQPFIVLGLIAIFGITACKKEAGSGGTSSVKGTLSGRIYSGNNGNAAESEITQITIPDGSDVSDGEYILLNTPNNGTYYYVWFKWDNGAAPDPGLSGRTGIQVTFNFSQSNTTIAANMAAAIQSNASADFSVELTNDIVTLTNTATGDVPDADELTSNVLIDIANQGKSNVGGTATYTEGPIADERVYIVYGDDDFYSEDVRTDAQGNFQFKELNRGDYRIFAYTQDTLNPSAGLQEVSVTATITEKKQVVQAPNLFVIHF